MGTVAEEVIKPRVFVANFAGHDYSIAEKYGELVFITKGFISFQGLDRVKYRVAQGMMEATAEDWLVLSGTNIINVLAALLWYQRHDCVKILNFDKTTQVYREIIVTRENNEKLLEALNDRD